MMDWTGYLLPENVFSAGVALVFGLMCGSFINVVVYRLPIMIVRQCKNAQSQIDEKKIQPTDTFNLALPASFCKSCHRPLTFTENIPLVSYFFLRGRCKTCQARISPRIPMVEAFSAVVCASIVWFYGVNVLSGATLFFLFSVLALALIDWDMRLLPDVIVFPLMWAGLLLSVHGMGVPPREAISGALAAYMALWLLRRSVFYRKSEAMGDGDLKLAMALGAWIGVGELPWLFVFASVAAILFVLASMAVARSFVSLQSTLPFGPFLGMAGVMLFLKTHFPFPLF